MEGLFKQDGHDTQDKKLFNRDGRDIGISDCGFGISDLKKVHAKGAKDAKRLISGLKFEENFKKKSTGLLI